MKIFDINHQKWIEFIEIIKKIYNDTKHNYSSDADVFVGGKE
jgi:hypothetical protein